MNNLRFIHLFARFYNLIWKTALPFLKTLPRLKQGFTQRISADHLTKADIWIHGASAGEAYLAVEIVKHLYPDNPLKIMLSSTTLQGMQILKANIIDDLNCTEKSFLTSFSSYSAVSGSSSASCFEEHSLSWRDNIICKITWFPFDKPDIMENAVSKINPAIMVILETELWPGLLMALKKRETDIMIINARLSNKSYKTYLKTCFLWRQLSPDHILAISDKDKVKFGKLFKDSKISFMPNIKFDAICSENSFKSKNMPLLKSDDLNSSGLFKFLQKNAFAVPHDGREKVSVHSKLRNCKHLQETPSDVINNHKYPMSMLVSIRREEEEDAEKIIIEILRRFPRQVVGLFPRHMHRIEHWKTRLSDLGLTWQLRSKIENNFKKKSVILWDVFGELKQIYPFAVTAFIGGSLKPLGGQNFIESVVWGTATVTGPFTDDFSWVGEDIFKKKIVKKVKNWHEVAAFMVNSLKKPCNRKALGRKARLYFMEKRGGTDIACRKIKEIINQSAE